MQENILHKKEVLEAIQKEFEAKMEALMNEYKAKCKDVIHQAEQRKIAKIQEEIASF